MADVLFGATLENQVTHLIFVAIWVTIIFAGFAIPQLFDRDVAGAFVSAVLMIFGLITGPIVAVIILRFGFKRL